MVKFIIVGAGWYGCFLGLIFKTLNIEFVILEKQSDIFNGSSSKNQNRLHQGFHYPRSQNTRNECIKGYELFVKLFNFMTCPVKNNYYLLEKNSNVKFNDYVKIYENDNLEFTYDNNLDLDMNNIDGIIKCNEKLINHNLAYTFFKKILCDHTILNVDDFIISDKLLYNNIKYDYLIDCTYGQMFKNESCEYELCVSLIYNSNVDYAITLMDGPFFSIYPYLTNDNINKYTLTDVEYTPLFKSNNIDDVYKFEKNINNEFICLVKDKMENKVKKYLPNFNENFTYENYNISYKCKFINNDDDRSVRFYRKNNILSFVGGKITGIFGMATILFDEFKDIEEFNKYTLGEVYDMMIKRFIHI